MNNQIVLPHPQTAARTIEGQAVVVLAESGTVHVLDEVGTRIWELADGTRTVCQIATALTSEFDVSLDVALADTREFIQKLSEARAVELR